MKIALIGYGKMGKEIEKIAIERNHTITAKVDRDNLEQINNLTSENTDVAIEFSNPESAFQNISNCLKKNIPIVSGTTGWWQRMDEMIWICEQHNGTFFHASNFSIGVNITFAINKKLAAVMNAFDNYDCRIEETHHTQKLDSPSGTAIVLADGIIENLNRKKVWRETEEAIADELKIKAHRIENVPGTHSVIYESDIDYIELKHSAKSRKGFAMGAVLAAEFIQNKKGVYGMNDLLELDM